MGSVDWLLLLQQTQSIQNTLRPWSGETQLVSIEAAAIELRIATVAATSTRMQAHTTQLD